MQARERWLHCVWPLNRLIVRQNHKHWQHFASKCCRMSNFWTPKSSSVLVAGSGGAGVSVYVDGAKPQQPKICLQLVGDVMQMHLTTSKLCACHVDKHIKRAKLSRVECKSCRLLHWPWIRRYDYSPRPPPPPIYHICTWSLLHLLSG